MRAVLSLLFCFCIVFSSFSQTNSNYRDKANQKHAITLSAAIFPYQIGMQPGFQFRLGKKFDLISECAFSLTGQGNNNYDEVHFFKWATELKYYPGHAFGGKYFSFQAGYIQRKFQAKDSGWYWKNNDPDATGYSSDKIKAPVAFTVVKWGREVELRKSFFLDFFLGLGARYIRTTYDVQDSYNMGHLGGARDNIFELAGYSWEHEGTQTKLNGTAGIRIGKRF
jgi:hypothetical protein